VAHHTFSLEKETRGKDEVGHHWHAMSQPRRRFKSRSSGSWGRAV